MRATSTSMMATAVTSERRFDLVLAAAHIASRIPRTPRRKSQPTRADGCRLSDRDIHFAYRTCHFNILDMTKLRSYFDDGECESALPSSGMTMAATILIAILAILIVVLHDGMVDQLKLFGSKVTTTPTAFVAHFAPSAAQLLKTHSWAGPQLWLAQRADGFVAESAKAVTVWNSQVRAEN
jgi:hypothetical protein